MSTTKEERIAAIDEAIAKAGGIVRFCKQMSIRHQSVYGWRTRGWVPPERALAIEAILGVARERLLHPNLAAALSSKPSADDLL